MDSILVNHEAGSSGWSIYLLSFLLLIALYFIQKFVPKIDHKFHPKTVGIPVKESKPWPLWLGLLLGIFALLYNVFSPTDMQWGFFHWQWGEWTLVLGFTIGLILLAIESFGNYTTSSAAMRIIFYALLMFGFFVAGWFAGLLIAFGIAAIVLLYFLLRWRKLMVIK